MQGLKLRRYQITYLLSHTLSSKIQGTRKLDHYLVSHSRRPATRDRRGGRERERERDRERERERERGQPAIMSFPDR